MTLINIIKSVKIVEKFAIDAFFLQGDFETAARFYMSSLKLDPNFEPSITRLRVILCFLLFDDKKFAMSEIMRNIL